MVLHSYYSSDNGDKVYLDSVCNGIAFYKVGIELVTSTVEFFTSKYKILGS